MTTDDKPAIEGTVYTGPMTGSLTGSVNLVANCTLGSWAKLSPEGELLEFDEAAMQRHAKVGDLTALTVSKLLERTRKHLREETDLEVVGYGYKHPDSDLIVQYEENPFVTAVDRGLDGSPSVPLCDYNHAIDEMTRLKLYITFVEAEVDYYRAALAEAQGEV